jgi:regulatory protein
MSGERDQNTPGAIKARPAFARADASRTPSLRSGVDVGRKTDAFADQATGRSAPAKAGPSQDPEAGPDADPEAVARQICLRMLTAAPRTQAQLAAALRRRRVPEAAAEAVLSRFAGVKLIDDAMFARAWVESRHFGRGLARRALGAELRQRGVAQEDIRAALEDLDPQQELATARQLVASRLQATSKMPAPARMRRLAGMLARKGYGPALAYRVVREALEHDGGDDAAALDDLADLPEPGEPDDTDSAELAGYADEAAGSLSGQAAAG